MRMGTPAKSDAQHWARQFARHPDGFERMLARSEPWLWHIVEIADRRHMPLELALLPAIESGFDPVAESPQKARGLWQLIPVTARSFGLANTAHYDARRDPIASTRAALGHLNDSYEQFGDWWLAIAAFNIGPARLARTLERQRHADSFWDLELPRETFEHARKLAGVCLLIRDPQRFGIRLPAIANGPATELVRLYRPVNLQQAARDAGIAESLILDLNPGLRQLTNTTGKLQLVLPKAEARRLRAALAAGDYAPEPTQQLIVHVVGPGDSLWGIARRYNVTIGAIERQNELDADSVIRPGRRLMVPVSI